MAVDVAERFLDWVSQTQDAEQRKIEMMKVGIRQLEEEVTTFSLISVVQGFFRSVYAVGKGIPRRLK